MNRQVNLTKRVRTSKGMRYCPVVLAANGRVKPDAVLVNGETERHTEGAYYLEWSEGSKRIRLSVGKDAGDADARRRRKAAELNADWPRYTEEEPEIYEPAELDKLFAACIAEEQLWYEFFLMTGEREQEVMFTYWSDVNFAASTVRVSHKPDRGWTPKAYKEREIPIPAKLVRSLKAWKLKADKNCSLVFPTAGCRPKLDFLDCLKSVAERAKLDADGFWLHKFRATFATRCLWAGVDLRTVQQWLGHSDMESTMRYLKPSRSQHVRDKVNEIFA